MELFWGKVRSGKARGRKLGFPTANIALHKKIPEGVYLSKTRVNTDWHPSLTFIGVAKTFEETKYQSETYLLNYNTSFYNQWITIKLIKKLRNNKKFSNADALVNQMKEDEKDAREYFSRTVHSL